jgi:hypothetical protein
MKLEIEIPTLKDIKLKQYQEFVKLLKEENDERILQIKMIEILCDFSPEAVSKIKASSLTEITNVLYKVFEAKPDLIKTFKIGDIEFGFIPNIEEITLGEYIDLDSYIGNFEDMNKAMAVLYRPIVKKKRSWFSRKEEQYLIEPYTGTEEYKELMKHTPLDVALSAYFFFVILRVELLNSTMNFLEEEIVKQEKILVQKHNSLKNGDGIIQYISSLREMLVELKKSQNLTFTNALPI